jgi:hypothetical protein
MQFVEREGGDARRPEPTAASFKIRCRLRCVSDRPAARARALLVADPDADPALVRSARAILAWGQVAVSQQSSTGDSQEYKQSLLKASIEDPEIDLVIVLRSERQPSREVQQAAMLCGEIGKPIHALVARGITPAVDVGEVHTGPGPRAVHSDPARHSALGSHPPTDLAPVLRPAQGSRPHLVSSNSQRTRGPRKRPSGFSGRPALSIASRMGEIEVRNHQSHMEARARTMATVSTLAFRISRGRRGHRRRGDGPGSRRASRPGGHERFRARYRTGRLADRRAPRSCGWGPWDTRTTSQSREPGRQSAGR